MSSIYYNHPRVTQYLVCLTMGTEKELVPFTGNDSLFKTTFLFYHV